MSNDLRKAAILLSCLDTDTADRLLEAMGDDQARLIRDRLVSLDDVPDAERQSVIDEFMRIGPMSGGPLPVSGSVSKTKEPTTGGLNLETPADTGYTPVGDNVPTPAPRPWTEVLQDHATAPVPAPSSRTAEESSQDEADADALEPFRFLEGADNEHLPPLLEGEHPQTIALVMSHLPPQRALGVLRGLSPATQADVIRRLVDLDEADPETLREVERGLETRMSQQAHRRERRNVGLALVSDILKVADEREEEDILSNLASYEPRLAASLDDRVASLDELSQLPDRLLAEIAATLDEHFVVLALLGTSSQLADRILAALPRSLARGVRRGMTRVGPVRLDDVERAKDELLAAARRHCRTATHGLGPATSNHPSHVQLDPHIAAGSQFRFSHAA